jgi:PPE-repeat protein
MSFAVLPPELNSWQIFAGPGSAPMLAAAAGNFMSGFYNTSILNLATQAFVSGFANFGTQLSGVLNSGTGP